jgi:3',5'-cyclic AMP phosphodiesterase CpdA
MRLYALSDLHIEHRQNREALTALRAHKQDWLILAGDVSDSVAGLSWTLDVLAPKFARLLWVPGNHELWTGSADGERERGEARYQRLVQVCRERSVLTPEDPFPEWPLRVQGNAVRIALLFLLYDYSFAPDAHVGHDAALAWAADAGILAADEVRLHSDPYPSREAWCRARVQEAERRLAEAARTHALVLVNHWPLRRDLVRLGRVARYAPWCGTRASEDYHQRYRALVSVHGHLHVRATDERDGVRFEEVSLGYPLHWDPGRGVADYLREIL